MSEQDNGESDTDLPARGDEAGGGTGDAQGGGAGADAGPGEGEGAPAEEAAPGSDEGEGTAARGVEALYRFTVEHRVSYDDIAAQGVVGDARWLALVQLGRVEYLRQIGMRLEGGDAPVQLVVRRTVVDYLGPARFDDPLLIRVRCSYIGNSSARFETIIDNIENGLRCVIADTLVVCLDVERFRSTPWPVLWRERIIELEGEDLQVGQG